MNVAADTMKNEKIRGSKTIVKVANIFIPLSLPFSMQLRQ